MDDMPPPVYQPFDDDDDDEQVQDSEIPRVRHHQDPASTSSSVSTGLTSFGNMIRSRTQSLFAKKPVDEHARGQQFPHHVEHRREATHLDQTLNLFPCHVPMGVEPGFPFFVAVPGGGIVSVEMPTNLREGEYIAINVPYLKNNKVKAVRSELREEARISNVPPEDRLLELYKRHNPSDHTAALWMQGSGIGLAIMDGPYGVQVEGAAYAGPDGAIQYGDIVTHVNDNEVKEKTDVQEVLSQVSPGDVVIVSLLRKSPPLPQRCPAGHYMQPVRVEEPVPPGSLCNRCGKEVWKDFQSTNYTCHECLWHFCEDCYNSVYEKLNDGHNANDPPPAWASEYEEAPFGTTLAQTRADVGKKVRIFWPTTGDWWLGEILSYHPDEGHVILYEEGEGLEARRSQERVQDITTRFYVVLAQTAHKSGTNAPDTGTPKSGPINRHDESNATVQETEAETGGSDVADLLGSYLTENTSDHDPETQQPAADTVADPPTDESQNDNKIVLTEDEAQLLQEIQSKYS